MRSPCAPAPTLINMEFIQFHPTGMVWPPSVKGILVTESVRGDGGVLRNSEGKRFMFDYVPDVFRTQYADSEEEADRWYADPENNKRPPELLPRDEVARAINSEVKAGRGTPHGGVFLDVSTRLPAEEITRRLPSMYHQFKELADVDITAEAMEVGPTCHYVMGGVEVDADTAATAVPGLYAAGEVAGGMHGSNRLGGNSLSDLLVFGRRAGAGAAEYVGALPRRPAVAEADLAAASQTALAPFRDEAAENPYSLHQELQQRDERPGRASSGARARSSRRSSVLDDLQARADRAGVEGHRQFNPGWHLALDLRNMLAVSACVAMAALERTESRGGHTREDFPAMDPQWRRVNLVCRADADRPRGQLPAPAGARDPGRPARAVRALGAVRSTSPSELSCSTDSDSCGGEHMSYHGRFRVWRGDADGRRAAGLHGRGQRGRGRSSTSSTGCRPPRRRTWPSGGTARPASAARAAPRSTAGRGCCA